MSQSPMKYTGGFVLSPNQAYSPLLLMDLLEDWKSLYPSDLPPPSSSSPPRPVSTVFRITVSSFDGPLPARLLFEPAPIMTEAVRQQFRDEMMDPNRAPLKLESPTSLQFLKDQLPVQKVDAKQIQQKDGCSVCQELFQLTESCVSLPCHHAFHQPCLLPWLNQHHHCPNCRFQLPTN